MYKRGEYPVRLYTVLRPIDHRMLFIMGSRQYALGSLWVGIIWVNWAGVEVRGGGIREMMIILKI